jgi:ABC-type transport system involved in multi-copper enzyme maturation permease subunit
MTATSQPPVTAAAPSSARREAWRVSLSGVRLVAGLELRQRVRSTKWKWALASVAMLIGGVTFLVWGATHAFGGDASGDYYGPGDLVFGLVVFFVLFLGLVVSPTLSATSINGDVRDGTMAPLQATALSAVDIVLGKLLASWAASLAFLVVALPFIVLAYFDGRMPALAMLTVMLVLAVELLVVCAIGLGWSALTARTPASAVLTYTTVAVLVAVLPIIFGLLSVTFTKEVTVTSSYREYVYTDGPKPVPAKPGDPRPPGVPDDAKQDEQGMYYVCRDNTYTTSMPRTEDLWWLLAVNPYVIVADSAPSPRWSNDNYYDAGGILSSLKLAVREARVGPTTASDNCDYQVSYEEQLRRDRIDALPAVWPWGLAAQALLAIGGVALGVRRLSVPYGKLPTGSRVA